MTDDGSEQPRQGGLATNERIHFSTPRWLREFGVSSWLLIGIAVVLIGLTSALSATRSVVIPTLFAALFAATFMPVVDWLERRRVPRWAGAVLVLCIVVAGAGLLVGIIARGLVDQAPIITSRVDSGLGELRDWLSDNDIDPNVVDSARSAVKNGAASLAKGAIGSAIRSVQSVAAIGFGIFIALNILVYLLIGGRQIGRWVAGVAKPVPPRIAYRIVADSVHFMRSYIWGSTIVGVFNGLIVGVGAAIIGVPLAATIGIIGWATNYIPMIGALIGGAFAVLIALGVGGWEKALLMLIFVIVANGPLQNIVQQFALGGALKLNGLVILFATTIGAVVGGAIGGVFAAPFVKIVVDAYEQLKTAGLFDDDEGAAAAAGAAPLGPTMQPETPPTAPR